MVKAIAFFDLDGTLLNAETQLDEDVIDAMHQLQKNDVLPVISSGRNLFEARNIMAQTGIDSLVGANGSYVMLHGDPIFTAEIDHRVISQFEAFVRTQNEAFIVLNDKDARSNRVTEATKQAYRFVNSPVPIVNPIYWQLNPIYMMIIMTDHDDDRYIKSFANDLTFYRNTPYSMDIVVKNGSKKAGMTQLLSRPEFKDVPTYAFGDGNNDISMLELVDHPIAMGNALDHVKPYAEFVTSANVDHGIVNGLKHFDLL